MQNNMSQQTPQTTPDIPAKFIDPETGEVRVEALIASYRELERKLSTMVPSPDTDDEARLKVLNILGVPETPDEYDVSIDHGLFEVDPDVNSRLHDKGFTAEQVQEVYNLAAEKLMPVLLEMTAELQADREVERLIDTFGGPEKWQEVSRQLLSFGKKNLPPAVLESLASSYDGVMALHRMMKGEKQAMTVRDDDAADAGVNDEQELRSMMRDPRYWRQKDPAFVAKVTKGFERLFGEG